MRKKKLIIDTNLFLLLVIGGVQDGRQIKNSKRLKKFNKDDYNKILEIMALHDEYYITPYIATETSNLIDLTGNALTEAFMIARELFSLFKQIDSSITKDCKEDLFLKFGLTDNSLIGLASNYFILTDDHRMLIPLCLAGNENIIAYYSP